MQNQKEVWLPVKDYEGFYEVSNYGRVKSLLRKARIKNGGNRIVNDRILKQEKVIGGYRRVSLSKNGKIKRFSVHRLVAFHFIQIDRHKPHVNHIDKKTDNNNVNNLEWVTRRENQTHANLNKKNKHYAIHYIKSMKSYQISVFYKGFKNYLGSTKDIKEAILIRNKFLNKNNIKNKYIC